MFAIAAQLPGSSISILANVEDFFNIDIFFKYKLNINMSIKEQTFIIFV